MKFPVRTSKKVVGGKYCLRWLLWSLATFFGVPLHTREKPDDGAVLHALEGNLESRFGIFLREIPRHDETKCEYVVK
jgi:hypothetical protein